MEVNREDIEKEMRGETQTRRKAKIALRIFPASPPHRVSLRA
jgi:hypothetical protein